MTYGCYFRWYETYWNAMIKDKYNILWLYYEDVVDNPLENVQKIAEFIFDGDDEQNAPEKVLNISEDGYDGIVERIKIDNVRKEIEDNPQTFHMGGGGFFRKGVNNDWVNYMTSEQSELIDETMYFKWAENCYGIKYYPELMEKYNDTYNKGYF